jgi:hypothetical protein
MLSTRAILSVKYTAAGAKAGRAVSGFLRYVHYRDQHEVGDRASGVGGLVRYVAYRDQASPQGRLFDARGAIGDGERKRLVEFVNRSLKGSQETSTRRRAVYRMVLSPEDARGLDLKQLTRSVMAQLARDAGLGGLPPWVAAEHRNTAHPHVHIVMAAQREISPGQFRGLVITRERLARMKSTLGLAIEQQRGVRTSSRSLTQSLMQMTRPEPRGAEHAPATRPKHDRLRRHPAPLRPARPPGLRKVLRRLSAQYRWEAEQEARRHGWERDRGGWER